MRKLKKILQWTRCFNPGYTVFYYHRIKTATPEELSHGKILGYEFALDPAAFEAQVQKMSAAYHMVSVDDILSGKIPNNSALITFDDGYQDIYANAFPILKKYRVPAVVFLITDFVGTNRIFWWDELIELIFQTRALSFDGASLETREDRQLFLQQVLLKFGQIRHDEKERYFRLLKEGLGPVETIHDNLDWEQVREMRRHGIHIGSHTLTHPVLTQIPLEHAEREITASKLRIEQELGEPVHAFSYPHGDYNRSVRRIVQRAGYRCAFTVNSGINRIGDGLFELNRQVYP